LYSYGIWVAPATPKKPSASTAREIYCGSSSICQMQSSAWRRAALSLRQAYRYLQQAQRLKEPVAVAESKVAFTVKLQRSLIQRVRL
jgi:hypothetical protein